MGELKIITSPEFENKLLSYPEHIRPKMQFLRELVVETAKEISDVTISSIF